MLIQQNIKSLILFNFAAPKLKTFFETFSSNLSSFFHFKHYFVDFRIL